MNLKGGYKIRLQGNPAGMVDSLPEPDKLYIPLFSRRFDFSQVFVEDGQQVHPGQVLAKDPANFNVPLLAPVAGAVRLGALENHIILEDVFRMPEEPYNPDEKLAHAPKRTGSAGMQRLKALELGAWQFFQDAHTGALPDPLGEPQAILVSTMHLDSFEARGDVQIRKRVKAFARGLENLQSFLDYQPIHLGFPNVQSQFARRLRESLHGYAFIKVHQLPIKYPFGNPKLSARYLGLKRDEEHSVWAISVAGVLAMDRALTSSLPSTVRVISFGGPEVEKPRHLKVVTGYPLKDILENNYGSKSVRIINGGVLGGESLREGQAGVDTECRGLTVLAEHEELELLGFVRPGTDRSSYSNCFLSSLRKGFSEGLDTAMRGEVRPCISCGFCEEICPAGIMPHLIHKSLYLGELEEAEKMRVDLCIHCGLCSYVCPSKINLREQFEQAQEEILREKNIDGDDE